MTTHAGLRCSLGLVLSLSVFGQQAGRPPSTGPAPGGPTSPTPNFPNRGNSPTSPYPFPDDSLSQQQTPLYLSGKVVLDDGTPPADRVQVQLVCQTRPRTIGYTDRKGYFSADINDRRTMAQFADVSESNSGGFDDSPFGNKMPRGAGGMDRNLMGCSLQAFLPGYRSDAVNLGVRRSLDNPDVGTVFLHRLGNVEGLTISATSAYAPKDAIKALDKARDEQKKQKWDDAQKQLDKAVNLYPKYAAAWYELGNVQLQQRNSEAARQSYAKALEADPKFVSPYQQLAALAARDEKWQDVADDTDRLLKLNPIDFPQAWMFNAVANFNLKKFDLAEKSAQECVSRDSSHRYPKMNLLLGVLLAQKQDYSGAAQNLRNYLQYSPKAEDAEQVRRQLAEVEKFLTPEAQK